MIPPIPGPARDEVHQARAHPERAADEVLGPPDVPRRARAAAARASTSTRRRATRWSSTTGTSRTRSTASARSRPTRTSSASTASASSWSATTASSRKHAHQFYKDWTGPGFPRVLIVEIQHANPYYDDSYAVNSANLGPYGDAITYELIPAHREDVPRHRAGLGALHVRRIDRRMGGARRAGHVPRRVQRLLRRVPRPDRLPRLHAGEHLRGQQRVLRRRARGGRSSGPATATTWARCSTTIEEMNRLELVLGPEGPIGRPVGHLAGGLLAGRRRRLPEADLGQAHRRDRPARSPPTGASTTTCRTSCGATGRRGSAQKLRGKIHLYVGDMDNYYLNNAVYLVEDFLKHDDEPALRGRGGLRRPRRALLERRPHAAQRRTRACATTRCSRRRSSSGSKSPRRRGRT